MADRKQIMVAEDDMELAELIVNYLKSQNYEVTHVNNGNDALTIASTGNFDLLLLDVMMPYLDGYHVAYEISNLDLKKNPKIIIMTSRDIELEKSLASISGAFDTLQKPFKLDDLTSKIKKALE